MSNDTIANAHRPMLLHESIDAMSTWLDERRWVPLTEDEDGNITGPGHQDRRTFLDYVGAYYSFTGLDRIFATDLDPEHRWMVAHMNQDGEWTGSLVPEGTLHAVPVTVVRVV